MAGGLVPPLRRLLLRWDDMMLRGANDMFPIQLAEEARGPERTQHMSTTLACPHCKLSLTIQDGAGGSVLVYDQDERTRRCADHR